MPVSELFIHPLLICMDLTHSNHFNNFLLVPAAGDPDGFDEHNQTGRRWKKLPSVAQETFDPKHFEKLALTHFPRFSPVTAPNSTEVGEANDNPEEETAELSEHLECFRRLVNLKKVEQHLESGKLGQTIARSLQTIEKQGREEVGKIAVQVSLSFSQFHALFCTHHLSHYVLTSAWLYCSFNQSISALEYIHTC